MTLLLETIGGVRPWVAEITGTDEKFGLNREFLRGVNDYSRANSKKTRGVYTLYTMTEGHLYETKYKESWNKEERYYFRVDSGAEIRMDLPEVMAWIEERASK